MERNIEEETTFNFPTLPYVCQRRFAEICDSQTLKTFASINQSTRSLCKRCHIIKVAYIDYDASTCKYVIACYCREDEYCKKVNFMNLSNLMNKYEVMNKLAFTNLGGKKTDFQLFQSLPIKFDSIKELNLRVNSIYLDSLKKFITPS